MNEVYLLIGGNLGDRNGNLSKARLAIEKECGHIAIQSQIYETAAWGMEDQDPFLNQALKINTEISPEELLSCLLNIEEKIGRKRLVKYGPRLIDIDILLFNNEIINLQGLKIPHPEMQKRRFVLTPLNEIAANKVHPLFKKTVNQLLMECTDPLEVRKVKNH